MKDATATAMYGTRGANGVMIITTKSGRNIDKPIINFRVEGQITSPTSKPKFVDGATYMDLFNESLLNGGSTESPYSAEEIAGTRAGLNPYAYPNVNWYDELLRIRHLTRISMLISGEAANEWIISQVSRSITRQV